MNEKFIMEDNIPKNTKNKAIILMTPLVSSDVMREWWEETIKKMRVNPDYMPIKSIPKEEEL